jgi:hypothetical protein
MIKLAKGDWTTAGAISDGARDEECEMKIEAQHLRQTLKFRRSGRRVSSSLGLLNPASVV